MFPMFLLPRFDWVSCICPAFCAADEVVDFPISPGNGFGRLPGRGCVDAIAIVVAVEDNFVVIAYDFSERGPTESRIIVKPP